MIDDAGAEGVNFGCTDGNKLIGYGEVHHTHGDNWSEFQSVSTPNKTEYLNETFWVYTWEQWKFIFNDNFDDPKVLKNITHPYEN